jgi:hypothetical protein
MSGFDSRLYQIFWELVDLERGPLSLVSTIERLLEKNSGGSGLENLEYGRRDPSPWQRGTLNLKLKLNYMAWVRERIIPTKRPSLRGTQCSKTLALTSPTGFGHSVGIFRSWTQAVQRHIMKLINNSRRSSARVIIEVMVEKGYVKFWGLWRVSVEKFEKHFNNANPILDSVISLFNDRCPDSVLKM